MATQYGRLAITLALLAMNAPLPARAAARPTPALPDFTGNWERVGNYANLDPTIQRPQVDKPPLTPEFQRIYDNNLSADQKGQRVDPTAQCLPPGAVRMMNMVFPMEIIQKPGQLTIISEFMGEIRRIFLDGRSHPPAEDLEPTFSGHSIGHWEGRDLVAETVAIRSSDVLAARNGLQFSDALKMRERFHETDGNTLTVTVTYEDPKALTRPWTVSKTYRRNPKLEIAEYVCAENNREASPAPPAGGQAKP